MAAGLKETCCNFFFGRLSLYFGLF